MGLGIDIRGRNTEQAEQSGETIVVHEGRLSFERQNKFVPVKVHAMSDLHVGCHRLTWEAWKLLKKLVDGK